MRYWHDVNPWADRLVYVPLQDLAEAISGGEVTIPGAGIVERTPQYLLASWGQSGHKLDGYIVRNANGVHSVGVRYGAEGQDYLALAPLSTIAKARIESLLERHDADVSTAPTVPAF
jgi:hypothetical protein